MEEITITTKFEPAIEQGSLELKNRLTDLCKEFNIHYCTRYAKSLHDPFYVDIKGDKNIVEYIDWLFVNLLSDIDFLLDCYNKDIVVNDND